ncbi:unnamed protein product [Hydatigera taeniaeformis]|uniref:DUF5727 domain-containing protein n=1 Tax=Hydatigena taeniaeformis TaxID=6205 RepID=A0A158REX9_HYDTA|nr:unnamed protein product [Hydatigera taeniaeformis]
MNVGGERALMYFACCNSDLAMQETDITLVASEVCESLLTNPLGEMSGWEDIWIHAGQSPVTPPQVCWRRSSFCSAWHTSTATLASPYSLLQLNVLYIEGEERPKPRGSRVKISSETHATINLTHSTWQKRLTILASPRSGLLQVSTACQRHVRPTRLLTVVCLSTDEVDLRTSFRLSQFVKGEATPQIDFAVKGAIVTHFHFRIISDMVKNTTSDLSVFHAAFLPPNKEDFDLLIWGTSTSVLMVPVKFNQSDECTKPLWLTHQVNMLFVFVAVFVGGGVVVRFRHGDDIVGPSTSSPHFGGLALTNRASVPGVGGTPVSATKTWKNELNHGAAAQANLSLCPIE